MLDHISLGVTDLNKSRIFYDRVLEPLGYTRMVDEEDFASGYGREKPELWLNRPLDGNPATTGNGTHVAFAAPTRWAVDAFYAQALALGGRDCGKPGLRPEYGEHYYAAFVFDLDGHKIEAVISLPENN